MAHCFQALDYHTEMKVASFSSSQVTLVTLVLQNLMCSQCSLIPWFPDGPSFSCQCIARRLQGESSSNSLIESLQLQPQCTFERAGPAVQFDQFDLVKLWWWVRWHLAVSWLRLQLEVQLTGERQLVRCFPTGPTIRTLPMSRMEICMLRHRALRQAQVMLKDPDLLGSKQLVQSRLLWRLLSEGILQRWWARRGSKDNAWWLWTKQSETLQFVTAEHQRRTVCTKYPLLLFKILKLKTSHHLQRPPPNSSKLAFGGFLLVSPIRRFPSSRSFLQPSGNGIFLPQRYQHFAAKSRRLRSLAKMKLENQLTKNLEK